MFVIGNYFDLNQSFQVYSNFTFQNTKSNLQQFHSITFIRQYSNYLNFQFVGSLILKKKLLKSHFTLVSYHSLKKKEEEEKNHVQVDQQNPNLEHH